MTRLMRDSVTAGDIPRNPPPALVGGYVDGPYAWSPADWALFPASVHVRIATRATTNDGHVGDCETGDMTPAQAVQWVQMRRRTGIDPTIYCGAAAWPGVRAAFQGAGVPEPHYWIAHYGVDPVIPAGAVAIQYQDPPSSGGHWDNSAVADVWPGIDTPAGVNEMELTTGFIDWANNPQTVQTVLNHLDQRIYEIHAALFVPNIPSRIPGDTNKTDLRDAILDTVARVSMIMGEVGKLTTGSVDVAALADQLRAALAPEIVAELGKKLTA